MDTTQAQDGQPVPRPVQRLFRLVLLTGLLLPAILGIAIWLVLAVMGVRVVEPATGLALAVLPLTLLFLIPYFILAMLMRVVLVKKHARGPLPFRIWLHVAVGGYVGVTVVSIWLLSGLLPDFEAASMVAAMWPLTLPFVLLLDLGGVMLGGIVGWLVWKLRGRA
ncbi:hypothetical protein BJI67_11770 [Acidihalobacter aeolianus]|uniref:Uncharacterized protein n=1 Tax=Acidihalobacter aeolianus TaxID=2792603 RepID=A0A1D8K9M2_9GAMM|nr:hypothetical protein [Acidihalobacter aeolianus]AOV17646.1 hypothetical protein BJI67_11770 [Acidihalobacter aeolianus]